MDNLNNNLVCTKRSIVLLYLIICNNTWQVSEAGSSRCYAEVTEDGTLVGLYLLILGIFLVVFTLAYAFLQKHGRVEVPLTEKVHMKLNEEMKRFIAAQQFWIRQEKCINHSFAACRFRVRAFKIQMNNSKGR